MPEGSQIYCGTSIDQMYAREYGQDPPVPSLQLCIEGVDSSGACDWGYSCMYSGTISLVVSYHSAAHGARSAPGFRKPFRLKAARRSSAPRACARRDGSLLDHVVGDAASFAGGASGPEIRHRLSAYLR